MAKIKEITINELFAGIGAQASALERLNMPHKVINISDIDQNAVVSYAAVHCGLTEEMINTYTEYPTREEMARQLTEINLGYSFEKNKPYDWYKLARRKSKDIEKYWLANKLSKNLGDISKLDSLEYADFWTYSFPCVDISLAGRQQGIEQDQTRSGLLYEVQRLLERANKMLTLPKYLMLENVKNLVGKKFKPQFDEWISWLDELGYNTYWKVLNAKDYGIPQNRERVFAISIRKDIDNGDFEFMYPFDNGLRLKDLLEDSVDEKYYLSEEIQNRFILNKKNLDTNVVGSTKGKHNHRMGTRDVVYSQNGIMGALTATDYKQPKQILDTNHCIQEGNLQGGKWDKIYESARRYYSIEGISPTLHTCGGGNLETKIAEPLAYIKEATKKGYAEIYEGDAVNLERANCGNKRGRVGKQCAQTLTTSPQQVVLESHKQINHSEWKMKMYEHFIDDANGAVSGVHTNQSKTFGYKPSLKGFSRTLKANAYDAGVVQNYRVRKLTPNECWRLMGFTDEQFKCAKEFCSDSSLYKQAGNSIVVDVLYYMYAQLFNVEVNLPSNSKYLMSTPTHTNKQKYKKLW